jgi:hypothetical protein
MHNCSWQLTLSIWASSPSWLLCRVVSLTNSFAVLANCSNSEVWLPCRVTELPDTAPVVVTPVDDPKLDVRANTFPTLGWRCTIPGLRGGTCQITESATSTNVISLATTDSHHTQHSPSAVSWNHQRFKEYLMWLCKQIYNNFFERNPVLWNAVQRI